MSFYQTLLRVAVGHRFSSGGSKQDYFITYSQKFDQYMESLWHRTNGWRDGLGSIRSQFVRWKLGWLGAKKIPEAGKSHIEVKEATGPISWIHESGGTVELPAPEYDDTRIRAIYLATTGREE